MPFQPLRSVVRRTRYQQTRLFTAQTNVATEPRKTTHHARASPVQHELDPGKDPATLELKQAHLKIEDLTNQVKRLTVLVDRHHRLITTPPSFGTVEQEIDLLLDGRIGIERPPPTQVGPNHFRTMPQNPSTTGAQSQQPVPTQPARPSPSTQSAQPSPTTQPPKLIDAKAVNKTPCIFRRELPVPPAVAAFSSPLGKRLLREALNAGTAEAFYELSEQFRTQDKPSYCGISTLVMVLNTFKVDPQRIWQGCWRFFHEDMLNCCVSLEQVETSGINLDDWRHLASCNGADTILYRPSNYGVDHFRGIVKQLCTQDASSASLVVSYSRKHFEQTGDGHFSPIAAYHEERDLALIMDVARFKYPPHWVKVEDLFEAMQYKDPETNKERGYMVMKPSYVNSTLVFLLRSQASGWSAFKDYLLKFVDAIEFEARCGNTCDKLECVTTFLDVMPEEMLHRLTTYNAEFQELPYIPRDHEKSMNAIFPEIKQLSVYKFLLEAFAKQDRKVPEHQPVLATVLFLAFPMDMLIACGCSNREIDTQCIGIMRDLRDLSGSSELLQQEISALSKQMEIMLEKFVEANDKPTAKRPRCGSKCSASC